MTILTFCCNPFVSTEPLFNLLKFSGYHQTNELDKVQKDLDDWHEQVFKAYDQDLSGMFNKHSIKPDNEWKEKAEKIFANLQTQQNAVFDCPRLVWLLDFWAEQCPEQQFILLFTSPHYVFDQLSTVEDVAFQWPDIISAWLNYNAALLTFYSGNQGRCLLLNLEDCLNSPREFIETIAGKYAFDVSYNGAVNDEGAYSSVSYFDQICLNGFFTEYPELDILFQELNASAQPLVAKQKYATTDKEAESEQLFDTWLTYQKSKQIVRENTRLLETFKHNLTEQEAKNKNLLNHIETLKTDKDNDKETLTSEIYQIQNELERQCSDAKKAEQEHLELQAVLNKKIKQYQANLEVSNNETELAIQQKKQIEEDLEKNKEIAKQEISQLNKKHAALTLKLSSTETRFADDIQRLKKELENSRRQKNAFAEKEQSIKKKLVQQTESNELELKKVQQASDEKQKAADQETKALENRLRTQRQAYEQEIKILKNKELEFQQRYKEEKQVLEQKLVKLTQANATDLGKLQQAHTEKQKITKEEKEVLEKQIIQLRQNQQIELKKVRDSFREHKQSFAEEKQALELKINNMQQELVLKLKEQEEKKQALRKQVETLKKHQEQEERKLRETLSANNQRVDKEKQAIQVELKEFKKSSEQTLNQLQARLTENDKAFVEEKETLLQKLEIQQIQFQKERKNFENEKQTLENSLTKQFQQHEREIANLKEACFQSNKQKDNRSQLLINKIEIQKKEITEASLQYAQVKEAFAQAEQHLGIINDQLLQLSEKLNEEKRALKQSEYTRIEEKKVHKKAIAQLLSGLCENTKHYENEKQDFEEQIGLLHLNARNFQERMEEAQELYTKLQAQSKKEKQNSNQLIVSLQKENSHFLTVQEECMQQLSDLTQELEKNNAQVNLSQDRIGKLVQDNEQSQKKFVELENLRTGQIKEYKKEIENLKKLHSAKIIHYKSEGLKLAEAIEKYREMASSHEQDAQLLTMQASQIQSELNETHQKYQEVQKELKITFNNKTSIEDELKKGRKELKRCNENIIKIKESSAQEKAQMMAKVQQENVKQKETIHTLKANYERQLLQSKKNRQVLISEKEELTKRLQKEQNANDNCMHSIKKLRTDLSSNQKHHEHEKEQLFNKLNAAEKRILELQAFFTNANKQLEALQQKGVQAEKINNANLVALQEKYDRVSIQSKNEKQQIIKQFTLEQEKVKKKAYELNKTREQSLKANYERQLLQSKKNKQVLISEKEELTKRLQKEQNANDNCMHSIKKLRTDLSSNQKHHEHEKEQLFDKLNAAEKRILELQAFFTNANKQLEALQQKGVQAEKINNANVVALQEKYDRVSIQSKNEKQQIIKQFTLEQEKVKKKAYELNKTREQLEKYELAFNVEKQKNEEKLSSLLIANQELNKQFKLEQEKTQEVARKLERTTKQLEKNTFSYGDEIRKYKEQISYLSKEYANIKKSSDIEIKSLHNDLNRLKLGEERNSIESEVVTAQMTQVQGELEYYFKKFNELQLELNTSSRIATLTKVGVSLSAQLIRVEQLNDCLAIDLINLKWQEYFWPNFHLKIIKNQISINQETSVSGIKLPVQKYELLPLQTWPPQTADVHGAYWFIDSFLLNKLAKTPILAMGDVNFLHTLLKLLPEWLTELKSALNIKQSQWKTFEIILQELLENVK